MPKSDDDDRRGRGMMNISNNDDKWAFSTCILCEKDKVERGGAGGGGKRWWKEKKCWNQLQTEMVLWQQQRCSQQCYQWKQILESELKLLRNRKGNGKRGAIEKLSTKESRTERERHLHRVRHGELFDWERREINQRARSGREGGNV